MYEWRPPTGGLRCLWGEATVCSFNPDSHQCSACIHYADCFDEAYGYFLDVPPPADGPLKAVPNRHRDGHTLRSVYSKPPIEAAFV